MRKASGYTLLALSFLAWGAILALPIFQISVGVTAALTVGLIITSEVAFYLGVALLGREVWEKIKAFFRRGRGPS
jgi:membrane-associated PAP2 superfamily phosphatase